MPMKLEKTVGLLADCFFKAEKELRERIARGFPGADEETITTLFHDRLIEILDRINSDDQFASQFLLDIQARIGYIPGINEFASGIIAKVAWHPRQTEGKVTGGDFGLVVMQPAIENYGKLELKETPSARGLLCQAKRKPFNGRWGTLRKKQIEAIDRGYCSIVRYEYEDEGNRKLKEFKWTVCKDNSSKDAQRWLAKNRFPEDEYHTEEIIKEIGCGSKNIGTTDLKAIRDFIALENIPTITIHIDWKEDSDPRPALERLNRELQPEKEILFQYVKN